LPIAPDPRLERARLLASRLERLSADSQWARRASGLRGALLRLIERLEGTKPLRAEETADLDRLFERGYDILSRAAREIPAS
jgi:hypothetical protein